MRTCRDCKEVKPLTDYYRDSKSKDGRRSVCKKCCNAQRLAWAKGEGTGRRDALQQPKCHGAIETFLYGVAVGAGRT